VCVSRCKKFAENKDIDRTKNDIGKIVTVVTGFESGIDVKKIAKTLKNELACGGTYKNNIIELQGDHRKKIKELLVKSGFEEDSISE